MARTDAMNQKDEADFAAAYKEDQKPTEQSDDAAFGLDPQEAPGVGEPTGKPPTVAIDLDKTATGDDAGAAAGGNAGEGAAAGTSADGAAAPGAPDIATPAAIDVEKETQRLKSWEGRLKAQQAEIDKSKVAPGEQSGPEGADSGAGGEGKGEGEGDGTAAPGGMLDADDPDLKALSEDFGGEFVELLMKIIGKVAKRCAADVAGEHSAPVREDIDKIIAEITNEKQRNHFERISDAHPDFKDIAASAEFKAWIDAMEPADKTEADRVATAGSAREIIALLKKYKATLGSADSAMESAMDDAEGVRSTGGMKLPDPPASSQDYEKAWNEH